MEEYENLNNRFFYDLTKFYDDSEYVTLLVTTSRFKEIKVWMKPFLVNIRAVKPVFRQKPAYLNFKKYESLFFYTINISL